MPRLSQGLPFKFGEAMPETSRFIPYKNLWPLDLAEPSPGDWDTTRVIQRNVVDQFLQWFICASVAPRGFVYSYELGWNVEDLPAWSRYRKVWGLYGATDHLAEAHGFGPFPGPGEAWNIGPAQRRSLYPTLERWFGIPVPFGDSASQIYENLTPRPEVNRRPVDDLVVLTPTVAVEIRNRSVHEIAREQGQAQVQVARRELAKLPQDKRVQWMRTKWAAKLGDIEPNTHPLAVTEWTKKVPGAEVDAVSLTIEPGVTVPLLLLKPSSARGRRPVVVAVAEGGKDLFLAERSPEIQSLLKGGSAVCLPDLRGTGETSPDFRRDPDSTESIHANTLLTLGDTLVGLRLKDLQTVVAYLGGRPEIDAARIGLRVHPEHPQFTTADGRCAADHPHSRCFSGAVRSKETERFAGRHFEIDRIDSIINLPETKIVSEYTEVAANLYIRVLQDLERHPHAGLIVDISGDPEGSIKAVEKVKQAALSVQCMSNLRQCAVGFQTYANDNDGNIPVKRDKDSDIKLWPFLRTNDRACSTIRSIIASS